MKCHSLRDAIVELARDRPAGPGTRAAVDSHLEHCRFCAALMNRERQLSQGLRALAAATAADVPDALERRLLQAFAERQSVGEPGVTSGSGRSGWNRWLGAAAALLLVAGSSAWWLGLRGRPVAEGSTETQTVRTDDRQPQRAPAPVAALTPVAALRDDKQPPAPVVAGSHRPRATRPRTPRASQVVRPVGFVALPGAAGLPDFESGQIVRMSIPLTSLPTYGIEILPDAQGSPVEADLLVGQDGQARAIRLVNEAGGTR